MKAFTLVEIMIIIVIICLLVGIAVPCIIRLVQGPLTDCVVIGKKYHKAYTTTTFTRIGDVSVPNTTTHPERWTLRVKGYTKKNKECTRTIDVSEVTYQNIRTGDSWPDGA